MFQLQNSIRHGIAINLVSGDILKKRRILLGLSQNTLGEIIGASKQDIMKYEDDHLFVIQGRKIPLLNLVISLFGI